MGATVCIIKKMLLIFQNERRRERRLDQVGQFNYTLQLREEKYKINHQ